eukprot:scaffold326_cov169-Ochromonas_danica.AAC.14
MIESVLVNRDFFSFFRVDNKKKGWVCWFCLILLLLLLFSPLGGGFQPPSSFVRHALQREQVIRRVKYSAKMMTTSSNVSSPPSTLTTTNNNKWVSLSSWKSYKGGGRRWKDMKQRKKISEDRWNATLPEAWKDNMNLVVWLKKTQSRIEHHYRTIRLVNATHEKIIGEDGLVTRKIDYEDILQEQHLRENIKNIFSSHPRHLN